MVRLLFRAAYADAAAWSRGGFRNDNAESGHRLADQITPGRRSRAASARRPDRQSELVSIAHSLIGAAWTRVYNARF
jgi:hypothetical protein